MDARINSSLHACLGDDLPEVKVYASNTPHGGPVVLVHQEFDLSRTIVSGNVSRMRNYAKLLREVASQIEHHANLAIIEQDVLSKQQGDGYFQAFSDHASEVPEAIPNEPSDAPHPAMEGGR